jgi:hypothetical protein
MLIMFSHGLFCPVSGVSTKHDSEAKRPKFIHKYWEVWKPDLLIFSDPVKDVVPTIGSSSQELFLTPSIFLLHYVLMINVVY